MTDRLTPAQRSLLMSRIRGRNTKPELVVRSLLHKMGYRFRTHLRAVPGTPDVAFPARRKAILVHGCFWHQHDGCRRAFSPSTRSEFWGQKFRRTRERDQRLLAEAEHAGWRMLVIWECETSDLVALAGRLGPFLGPTKATLQAS